MIPFYVIRSFSAINRHHDDSGLERVANGSTHGILALTSSFELGAFLLATHSLIFSWRCLRLRIAALVLRSREVGTERIGGGAWKRKDMGMKETPKEVTD
jgi:hypothetical protein